MTDLVYLLLHPMHGTETSERNIMAMAANEIDVLKEHCGQEGGNPRIDWYRLRSELVYELKKMEANNG